VTANLKDFPTNALIPFACIADFSYFRVRAVNESQIIYGFTFFVAGNKFRCKGLNYPQGNLLTLDACKKRYTEICGRYLKIKFFKPWNRF
jgi:hypothetical protein